MVNKGREQNEGMDLNGQRDDRDNRKGIVHLMLFLKDPIDLMLNAY